MHLTTCRQESRGPGWEVCNTCPSKSYPKQPTSDLPPAPDSEIYSLGTLKDYDPASLHSAASSGSKLPHCSDQRPDKKQHKTGMSIVMGKERWLDDEVAGHIAFIQRGQEMGLNYQTSQSTINKSFSLLRYHL